MFQVCLDVCETEGSTVEEQQKLDEIFEKHFRNISPMKDVAKHLTVVIRSLVIPELKKKDPECIALDKALQILALISETGD